MRLDNRGYEMNQEQPTITAQQMSLDNVTIGLMRELAEMFAAQTARRPELVETVEFPAHLQAVIVRAAHWGVTAPIVVRDRVPGINGRVVFHEFRDQAGPVIEVALSDCDSGKPRADIEVAWTLAHELGHVAHMQDGIEATNENFVFCEATADAWAVVFMDREGVTRAEAQRGA